MRHLVLVPLLCASALLLAVRPAAAQFVGTFSWQSTPYCNIVTLNVTQAGSDYILEGFDNQCGAATRAPVTGTATLNPDGTVGLGLVVVNTPGAEAIHMDVAINIATLGGPWSDSSGNNGTFVFNGAGGGNRRPTGQVTLTSFGSSAFVIGRRANGTAAAPTTVINGSVLLFLGARAHDGTTFASSSDAFVQMTAAESWTSTQHGARIDFGTTANGTLSTGTRMRIDHDGQVGIGTTTPGALLDVDGNIRVGTGAVGCVEDSDGTVIAGACASDKRFKRDVVSFEPMLSKVAALRPVHFYWRTAEFPKRAFGERQSYGLMAQEVEEILPELVTTDAEGYKAVNYSKLPLLAVQAIKDLKAENDDLKAQLASIERRLASLEAERK